MCQRWLRNTQTTLLGVPVFLAMTASFAMARPPVRFDLKKMCAEADAILLGEVVQVAESGLETLRHPDPDKEVDWKRFTATVQIARSLKGGYAEGTTAKVVYWWPTVSSVLFAFDVLSPDETAMIFAKLCEGTSGQLELINPYAAKLPVSLSPCPAARAEDLTVIDAVLKELGCSLSSSNEKTALATMDALSRCYPLPVALLPELRAIPIVYGSDVATEALVLRLRMGDGSAIVPTIDLLARHGERATTAPAIGVPGRPKSKADVRFVMLAHSLWNVRTDVSDSQLLTLGNHPDATFQRIGSQLRRERDREREHRQKLVPTTGLGTTFRLPNLPIGPRELEAAGINPDSTGNSN